MAKIQFSSVVGDARNKIGGSVFTKVRFGAMVRRKVSPVQPRTSRQTTVRALLTLLSKRWGSTLTAAQRAGWESLAGSYPRTDVFGNSYTLTGLQMYTALNRNLQLIGVTIIDDAPASLSVGSPGSITATATIGTPNVLDVTPVTDPAAGEVPVVFAARPVSAGRKFITSLLRYIFQDAAATAGPYDAVSEYEAKFGTMVAGQNISVGLIYINNSTGAASHMVTAQSVAA